ncbi:RER1 protein [Backusella circina FSU 941]|nr:RER1 protein [Backusella circina FSU 941]
MEEIPETKDNVFTRYKHDIDTRWKTSIDRLTPFTTYRWIFTGSLLVLFLLRIIIAQGWYIICYALGIYLLNMFLAFLTPKFDPSIEEEEEDEEGPTLPTSSNEEFKPFIRRLPEFKFWYSATKATVLSLFCSFFTIFDIPVYWPILLVYFCLLFALTMRRQIQHMIKYRYVPFDVGKKKYSRQESAASE